MKNDKLDKDEKFDQTKELFFDFTLADNNKISEALDELTLGKTGELSLDTFEAPHGESTAQLAKKGRQDTGIPDDNHQLEQLITSLEEVVPMLESESLGSVDTAISEEDRFLAVTSSFMVGDEVADSDFAAELQALGNHGETTFDLTQEIDLRAIGEELIEQPQLRKESKQSGSDAELAALTNDLLRDSQTVPQTPTTERKSEGTELGSIVSELEQLLTKSEEPSPKETRSFLEAAEEVEEVKSDEALLRELEIDESLLAPEPKRPKEIVYNEELLTFEAELEKILSGEVSRKPQYPEHAFGEDIEKILTEDLITPEDLVTGATPIQRNYDAIEERLSEENLQAATESTSQDVTAEPKEEKVAPVANKIEDSSLAEIEALLQEVEAPEKHIAEVTEKPVAPTMSNTEQKLSQTGALLFSKDLLDEELQRQSVPNHVEPGEPAPVASEKPVIAKEPLADLFDTIPVPPVAESRQDELNESVSLTRATASEPKQHEIKPSIEGLLEKMSEPLFDVPVVPNLEKERDNREELLRTQAFELEQIAEELADNKPTDGVLNDTAVQQQEVATKLDLVAEQRPDEVVTLEDVNERNMHDSVVQEEIRPVTILDDVEEPVTDWLHGSEVAIPDLHLITEADSSNDTPTVPSRTRRRAQVAPFDATQLDLELDLAEEGVAIPVLTEDGAE